MMLSPQEWAEQEFSAAELGDKRRMPRAVQLAAALAADPAASIPRASGNWGDTKAAYRLFKAMDVTFPAISQPHWNNTRQALPQASVVLAISDTTTISFDLPQTVGLGPTSANNSGHGMLLHSTLNVDVSGGIDRVPQVMGLSYAQLWTREPRNKSSRGKKGKKPPKNALPPESVKWPNAIEALGPAPQGVRLVHVFDAEGDCWEAIDGCRQQGSGCVIRSCQNRLMIAGHDADPAAATQLLHEQVRDQPSLGTKRLWVRRRQNEDAGWVELCVSAMPVTLLAPKNWSDKPHRRGLERPEPVHCWAVRVWEAEAPAGSKPIEWILLTDEPAVDMHSALRVTFWYSCRWLVEEYHKCLKTGCRVEQRQLEYADRLEPLVGMLSVLAVRLLQLKHLARTRQEAPAKEVVPAKYVKTLALHRKKKESMTVREFYREVAKMGGFLARKSDGEPGWLTLWRGWLQLELMTQGFELAKRIK